MSVLASLLSFGFDIVSLFFRLLIAVIVGFSMSSRGRNGLLWGIAALIFPWIIMVTFLVPRKTPKLNSSIRNHPDFAGRNDMVSSIMMLSAVIAKADGQVSKGELKLTKEFVQKHFRVDSMTMGQYEGPFNYGKDHPEDYQVFTQFLRSYGNYNLLLAISYLFVGIGLADGQIGNKEEQVVKQIIYGLGFNDYIYQSIKNHYSGGGQQSHYQRYAYGNSGYSSANGYGQVNNQAMIQKYSDILGVSADADLSTIKKAYRKMVKDHHPDNMAQEGMPKEYIEYAEQRIKEINEAYDYLKNAKQKSA